MNFPYRVANHVLLILLSKLHASRNGSLLPRDAFLVFNRSRWIGVNAAYPSGNDKYPFGQVNSVREARIAQLAAKIVF